MYAQVVLPYQPVMDQLGRDLRLLYQLPPEAPIQIADFVDSQLISLE